MKLAACLVVGLLALAAASGQARAASWAPYGGLSGAVAGRIASWDVTTPTSPIPEGGKTSESSKQSEGTDQPAPVADGATGSAAANPTVDGRPATAEPADDRGEPAGNGTSESDTPRNSGVRDQGPSGGSSPPVGGLPLSGAPDSISQGDGRASGGTESPAPPGTPVVEPPEGSGLDGARPDESGRDDHGNRNSDVAHAAECKAVGDGLLEASDERA